MHKRRSFLGVILPGRQQGVAVTSDRSGGVGVKSRSVAGATSVFIAVATMLGAAQAQAGAGTSQSNPVKARHSRTPRPLLGGWASDPKCAVALDTIMESCDGRDIGAADDQAGDGNYADAGEDDGDYDADQYDDGFEIVGYVI